MDGSLDILLGRIRDAMGHRRVRLTAECGKLMVREERCPECGGAGSILLLTTTRCCGRCGGKGAITGSIELPLTATKVQRFCRSLVQTT